MARVTVEDCIDKVDNRFELVLLAGHRARLISQGAPITIARDNDKNPVVALREIADETLSPGDLKEDLIHSLQKHVEVDEPEADGAGDRRPDRRRRRPSRRERRRQHRLRPHVGRRTARRHRRHGRRRKRATISEASATAARPFAAGGFVAIYFMRRDPSTRRMNSFVSSGHAP